MKGGSLTSLVGHLRRAARQGGADAPDDGELLRRWVQGRDEAAFELLVWRHGRLVLGVCQRVLGCRQDAEDAFQATFLVLVKKAGGIQNRQAVASWLHTVALRVALEARDRPRRDALADAATLDRLPGKGADAGIDLREALDEEVRRLPERYRRPFLLHHLQGLSVEDCAGELGCPAGTVLSRLHRARERLRGRLARRGIAPDALAGPVLAGAAGPSQGLVCSTTATALSLAVGPATGAAAPAAVALMEGALRAMFITKVKALAVAVVAAAALGIGGGVGYHSFAAGWAAGGEPDDAAARRAESEDLRKLEREAAAAEEHARALRDRLRLLELARARARADSRPKPKPGPEPVSSPQLNWARPAGANPLAADHETEVELLKLRLRAREAALAAAKATADDAARALADLEKLHAAGTVSTKELSAARAETTRSRSDLVTRDLDLAEARVLLKAAERRIVLGDRVAATPATPALERRVADLEDMVKRMQKELNDLKARKGELGDNALRRP